MMLANVQLPIWEKEMEHKISTHDLGVSVESMSSAHDATDDSDRKEIDPTSRHEVQEPWQQALRGNVKALMWCESCSAV